MLVLTTELIRRWTHPFALGCTPWVLTIMGTWIRQCGDVVLRVSLVPGTLESNPTEGLYVKSWLLGSVKLRVDGAELPLADDVVTELWVQTTELLSKHGVLIIEAE